MSIPKKITQHEHKIGYWKGRDESREFVTLGNFGLQLLKFVQASEQLPDYMGFLVRVSQSVKRRGGTQVLEG